METGLQVVGIDHVALNVADLERMTAFYRDVLGCEEDLRQESVGLVHLRAGSVLIDLIDQTGPLGALVEGEGRNLNHFCLQVADFDADAARSALSLRGVDVCEVRERHGSDGKARTLYLRDPEGNGVELRSARTA
jgi:glyoxylase I family protein